MTTQKKRKPKKSPRRNLTRSELQEVHDFILRVTKEDLENDLDPKDNLEAVLRRISSLAERAIGLNQDKVLDPGLEILSRVAAELEQLCEKDVKATPADRGDVRDRHSRALTDVLVPTPLERSANCILTEAAVQEKQRGETQEQVDGAAVRYVETHLGARLPRSATKKGILKAVKAYRAPQLKGGRPKKGGIRTSTRPTPGSKAARMEALIELVGLEISPKKLAEKIAKQDEAGDERLARLLR